MNYTTNRPEVGNRLSRQPPWGKGFSILVRPCFRRNGCKVASASFGWWRLRRYKVMWDAVKFARICQRFGWSAWLAPSETRKGGEA